LSLFIYLFIYLFFAVSTDKNDKNRCCLHCVIFFFKICTLLTSMGHVINLLLAS